MRYEKGFTLVELLVALFVVTTAFTAIAALMSQNIRSSTFTETQLQAVFLAQEGVEIVRNIRDDNVKAGRNWNEGLGNGEYAVQYDVRELLTGGEHEEVLMITEDGFFTYDQGDSTGFRRVVEILSTLDEESEQHLRVTSRVTWQSPGGEEENVVVETRLYDNSF